MTTWMTASAGMAEQIAAYDWDGSPIGPRSSWPPALRLTVDIALASGFPMLVFWGPDLVQIYNDAFVPMDVHDRRADGEALRERYARDHAVSLAFQNAALPRILPTVPGLTFDAMYEAAGEDALVGGDWYDAFRLPDGRVVISVGGVGGSGLEAAITRASRAGCAQAAHVEAPSLPNAAVETVTRIPARAG